MSNLAHIAGIVLAGGRSSRMGQNKALLRYKDRPLIEHMMDILRNAGIQDIFISGSIENYSCLADNEAYAGPAAAIRHVLKEKPGYYGYLFIPVDMPLISPEIIKKLILQNKGGYFMGHPLPAFITPPFVFGQEPSVQGFLNANNISPINLPVEYEKFMANTNTPREWKDILDAS